MKRINPYIYEVADGERVTVAVSSIGVEHSFVAATLNGNVIEPHRDDSRLKYSFEVSAPDDTAHLAIEGAFINASEGARYDLRISSSKQTSFDGPTITPDRPSIELRFTRTGGPR